MQCSLVGKKSFNNDKGLNLKFFKIGSLCVGGDCFLNFIGTTVLKFDVSIERGESLYTSQVARQPGAFPGFCSMKSYIQTSFHFILYYLEKLNSNNRKDEQKQNGDDQNVEYVLQ